MSAGKGRRHGRATGSGESRNTREDARAGDFSDPRVRWPEDEWDRTEQPDPDTPHSRAGGRRSATTAPGMHQPGTEEGETPGLPGSGGSAAGSKMDAYTSTDESIRDEVRAALDADESCDARSIEVEVRDGAVVLEGRVPTRPMKRRAAEIANAAGDVRTVDNRLQVD